ncbi:hypothetical protein PPACK8108_LOCUS19422 [Phakopsora pachyrhizi]|uniref:Uncharacterized protein n=1 Tax=Phakopsora pachyrhizi TaxID=170000 RepID=A0AAV0BEN7_PHAPC|nr:hypothetical protein PPACK8108_LOCUS19422 [Phakopsora pachyrhizi]
MVPSGTTESSSTHLISSSSTTTSFILKIALCSTQMYGWGISLTAEKLNWLITNTLNGNSPAIKTLQFCLRVSPESHQSLLRALVRSNGSISSQATSRSSLSTNASLSRVFERIRCIQSRLLSVLPFTLKEIEVLDGPRSGTGKVEGSGGFCAKDVVLARREAALFGLEKIGIRRNNSSRIRGGSSLGVKGSRLNA